LIDLLSSYSPWPTLEVPPSFNPLAGKLCLFSLSFKTRFIWPPVDGFCPVQNRETKVTLARALPLPICCPSSPPPLRPLSSFGAPDIESVLGGGRFFKVMRRYPYYVFCFFPPSSTSLILCLSLLRGVPPRRLTFLCAHLFSRIHPQRFPCKPAGP